MMSGTSQATALVTGSAALVLQQHPSWSPAQVKSALLNSATSGVVTGLPGGVPNRLLDALSASRYATTISQPAPATTAAPAPTGPATFRIAWAPRVTGTAMVGERLVTDQGGWIPGASRTTVWYRINGGSWTGLGGGTSAVLNAADVGSQVVACTTGRTARSWATLERCPVPTTPARPSPAPPWAATSPCSTSPVLGPIAPSVLTGAVPKGHGTPTSSPTPGSTTKPSSPTTSSEAPSPIPRSSTSPNPSPDGPGET